MEADGGLQWAKITNSTLERVELLLAPWHSSLRNDGIFWVLL